ncbi:L,D-transpeptidase family protein [Phosphitispora sp. TUW77]|uniref:L,D-transpeptidase family protein n=1 Tax=Phosphitispora sp. TUW77 TaxID=3152361 RepID=UPI003AB20329
MKATNIYLIRKSFLIKAVITTCFVSFVLWALHYSGYNVFTHKDPAVTELTVNFLLPMQQNDLESKISIIPEIPTTKISYKIMWTNSSTAVITMKQDGLPYGQLINVKINRAETKLPLIKKSFQARFRPRVPVSLISGQEINKICTKGPVPIIFNVPMMPKDMANFVKLPIVGKLVPEKNVYKGESYTDYSRWQYIPLHPLKNNASYGIIIAQGLRSKSGVKLVSEQKITFDTAPPINILRTNPRDQSIKVPLYKNIEINLDHKILKGSIKVSDLRTKTYINGLTKISGNKIIFKPENCFLPGRCYRATADVTATNNESLNDYNITFITLKMNNTYWLDVKVGETHRVIVYKGDEIIRWMPASGGRPETPTPLGFYYTQDRGHSFWSPRFGEGATYWIRLVGQVLIHSVPRDNNWQIKQDEHEKLGLPASHGCIRLSEEDAKWVFQNIPGGTLVIIHL